MIRYTNNLKTRINFSFTVAGIVKENDITGTLLSVPGLTLADYALTKLQNNQALGKIKVIIDSLGKNENQNVTKGMIELESNLDAVDNSILVSLLQNSIKKIHIHKAALKYHSHENLENINSVSIYKRALELMPLFSPKETINIRKSLEEATTSKKIQNYNSFTIGSRFNTSNTVFLVEGKKDVQNLVDSNFDNCIGLGGYFFNETELLELLKSKKVIAMVDGDSGGAHLLKKLEKLIDISEVVTLPKRDTAESLSKKALLECIQSRKPYVKEEASAEKN